MAAAAAERDPVAMAASSSSSSSSGPARLLLLTELPGELLELILCCGPLSAADVGRLACACRRLREACQPRGKVWREQLRRRAVRKE